jgi:hypothetical protein
VIELGEMRMLKNTSLIACFFLLYLLGANALASTPDLSFADWSVNARPSLAVNPPSNETVLAFLAKMEGIAPNFAICSAQFVNLRHSNNLSLVVSASYGRFCDLSIYDKTPSGFEVNALQIGQYTEGPEIKDLGGNGNFEIIVPTDFTEYQGAQYCVAQWPVIYAWTGNAYSDVSSRYKGYYEKQLTSLQKQIAQAEAQKQSEQLSGAQGSGVVAGTGDTAPAVQQSADNGSEVTNEISPPIQSQTGEYGPSASFGSVMSPPVQQVTVPPPPDSQGLNCTKAEAAKIERYLSISRDAGIGDAIKWANSDNPYERAFAADVLGDIATPEAIDDLRTLSHDPDNSVALSAKTYLEDQSPVVYTVDRELIAVKVSAPSQSQ